MGWFDIAILLVILLSGLISLVRGFVKESISLATWLAAGFIALSYHQILSEILLPYQESPTFSLAAAFAALFVATLIVGAIINFMVSQLVSKTGLSGTDKTLGVVFGIARGVLIIALFNYYISVAKDESFKRRFFEMAGLSLGVAVFSFFIGFLIRAFLGVDI